MVDLAIETECSLTAEDKEKAWNNAIERAGIFNIVGRRVSHWTQGIAIGTKLKNIELAAQYYDEEKLNHRKFATFKDDFDDSTFSVFRNTLRKPKVPPS